MSQQTAVRSARSTTRPVPRSSARSGSSARSTGPRLRAVSAPVGARSRAGLVVGCLSLLAVGLVGLLMLNMSLENGAFVRRHQQARLEQLIEQQEALTEELAALEAPQALAGRAVALGMVAAPNVAFVRSDGRVLGVPSPGVVPRLPGVTIRQAPAGQGSTAGPAANSSPLKGTTVAVPKASAGRKTGARATASVGKAVPKSGPKASSTAAPKVGAATAKARTSLGKATAKQPVAAGTA